MLGHIDIQKRSDADRCLRYPGNLPRTDSESIRGCIDIQIALCLRKVAFDSQIKMGQRNFQPILLVGVSDAALSDAHIIPLNLEVL